jgi:hypothetical protein
MSGHANKPSEQPTGASHRGHGRARPAVYAAGGVVAIGCLNAIGYIAFSTLTVGPLPQQLGPAGNEDRAAVSPNAATPTPPSAAPDQNVDGAPPAMLAKATPTAPDDSIARVVLPTLAPVRVILNMARTDSGRARRSGDIRRALAAAGLEVSDLVHVDAQRPGPSIGYYFQSDRNAATEVSRLLAPLLGVVDPVAFRKRGTIPEPGTIEIEIP